MLEKPLLPLQCTNLEVNRRWRTCLWNWLWASSPSISHESSRGIFGLWQQRQWEEKKRDKHAQRFPFRVHYSAVPGEPELRGGVNSYQVRKNTLTETYPSSLWHLHLNLLVLKDVEGESSSLCMSLHIRAVRMCAWCVRSKNPSLWYFQFQTRPAFPTLLKN